jgi:uncharacterized tellurite resistance protein B-like protein
MLRTLRDLFDSLTAPPSSRLAAVHPMTESHRLELATAVLLIEVMKASGEVEPPQRQAVIDALRRKFALSDDELARLIELAETTQRQATDFHAFTSALNEQLDHERKVKVIEAMWAVAYADGVLAAHEQHVLWRVADLLHVPQAAYINAKIRAKAAAGL